MSIEIAIAALNEAFANDPEAVNAIVTHRVPCNRALAEHPTVQVAVDGADKYSVAFIGLLNGAIEPLTGERIALRYEDGEGEEVALVGFCKYTPAP